MRFQIDHTTTYRYLSTVKASYNEARLQPVTDEFQTCTDFRLVTDPNTRLFSYESVTGRIHHFSLREPHDTLSIRVLAHVLTHGDPMAAVDLSTEDQGFYEQKTVRQRYAEFLAPTARVPLLTAADSFADLARRRAGRNAASFLMTLTSVLHDGFDYRRGATTVQTAIEEVLESRAGVCQDFAHVMLAICRRQAIPARYVSGYLYTGEKSEVVEPVTLGSTATSVDPSTRSSVDDVPKESLGRWRGGVTSDDAMHAWVECLLPDGKWRGFDPTHGAMVDGNYVKVQAGVDYGEVAPLRGVYDGPPDHLLEVSVQLLKVP